MEAKDIIGIIIGVALAAVIGFLFIKLMQNFMSGDGLIQKFISDILTTVSEKASSLLN